MGIVRGSDTLLSMRSRSGCRKVQGRVKKTCPLKQPWGNRTFTACDVIQGYESPSTCPRALHPDFHALHTSLRSRYFRVSTMLSKRYVWYSINCHGGARKLRLPIEQVHKGCPVVDVWCLWVSVRPDRGPGREVDTLSWLVESRANMLEGRGERPRRPQLLHWKSSRLHTPRVPVSSRS